MRHRIKGRRLGRNSSHRKALFKNMATGLILTVRPDEDDPAAAKVPGRIVTTIAKAKELRPVVEKLVTLAKRGGLHARRQAAAQLRDETQLKKLFEVIGPRYKERNGGYLRILKAGFRYGDNAAVAVIEFVDRDVEAKGLDSGPVIERAGQLLPKLLDFGIAKGDGDAVSPGIDAPGLTGHGSTLGSPHYMSPEQWSSPGDVDARADIYALGVLAFRCVSGELPFQGIDRAGLPAAHVELNPPALPPSVPAPVAQTIDRALAKQRDARWPSALAFGQHLLMSRYFG